MKLINRWISSLLLLLMMLNLMPVSAKAEEALGFVKVIVENNTFLEEVEGTQPAWKGVLIEENVPLKEESTMMSLVADAFKSKDYEIVGTESNYISSIHGLEAIHGGSMSGWMGTLNDWFTDRGFGEYTVKNGALKHGDEIRIQYTTNWGVDLGMDWSSSDQSLKTIQFSEGILSPAFDSSVTEYTLTLPKSLEEFRVTPTATNKNFKVEAFLEEETYRRNEDIPVAFGKDLRLTVGGETGKVYTFLLVPGNEVPRRKENVPEKGESSLILGKPLEMTLSDFFTDEDGDNLTYTVSIDGEKEIEASNAFLFTPEEEKTYELVFRAYDGDAYSKDTYTLTLQVAKEKESLLQSLLIHTSYSPTEATVLLKNPGETYKTEVVFQKEVRSYTLAAQTDGVTQLRFRAKPEEDSAKVILYYGEGQSKDITWKSGSSKWADLLVPGKNEFRLEVQPEEGSKTKKGVYYFSVDVVPTLTDLRLFEGKTPYDLNKTFSPTEKEYTVILPEDLDTVKIEADPAKTGYEMKYDGEASSTVDLRGKDKITVSVATSEEKDALTETYTLNLQRAPRKAVQFEVSPKDALVKVYDEKGRAVEPDETGTYQGLFGVKTYTYSITKYGYITKQGPIPAEGGVLTVSLEKVSGNRLPEVDAYWKNFRGSDSNMAITDVRLPIDTENINLKWNKKLGSGWSAAPSVQIIVDNALIVMAGNVIYKLDLRTGEILAQGNMVGSPSFGYTPPTYAEGMIFAPLGNGTIQAFNAKTLESVWVYRDALGGQSLSPIAYEDGYIYTGFWNGETRDANFVSISVTDEDSENTREAKEASWKYTHKGGFYWAGAVVVGDTVIVGSDDGTSGFGGTSTLFSFHQFTGEVISALEIVGDQRSAIAYEKESGRIYFTTKNGYLYRADVDPVTGVLTNLHGVDHKAQSTATPVVYKNRVYVGVGSGISSSGSSGNLLVADAESLEMIYAVGLKGYPQNAVLLTTAYEKETGSIYLYSTYNALPGGISMIKADPNATSGEDAKLIELYDAAGFAQYNLTGIIHDARGTLFYKNDSGNVLAVGVPEALGVIKLIDAVGDVTLDSKDALIIARNAYEAMYEEEKAQVTNYEVLVQKEKAYRELILHHVHGLIEKIGEVSLKSESQILLAREAYDSLTAEEKEGIKTLEVLLDAERSLALLKKEVQTVIDLIDEMGEVTLVKEETIRSVRTSYEALTLEQKEQVHNVDWLLYAEEKLLYLKSEEADKAAAEMVMDLIRSIGAVSEKSKEALVEARNAYEALTPRQKSLVTNLKDLQEAEDLYESLLKEPEEDKEEEKDEEQEVPKEEGKNPQEKPSKEEKPGKVPSTDGKTPLEKEEEKEESVQEESAASEGAAEGKENIESVSAMIRSLKVDSDGLTDLKALFEAYTAYEALSKEEKTEVENGENLAVYTEAYKKKHHLDPETQIKVQGLPWYVKVQVQVHSLEEESLKTFKEEAATHKILGIFNITLVNALTKEAYTPEKSLEVRIPLLEGHEGQILILHEKKDGTFEYLEAELKDKELVFQTESFSVFGVLGLEDGEVLEAAEVEKNSATLWLVLGVLLTGALAGLTVMRKKNTKREA